MLQCSNVAMLLCCYSQTVENRDFGVLARSEVGYRTLRVQQCSDTNCGNAATQ